MKARRCARRRRPTTIDDHASPPRRARRDRERACRDRAEEARPDDVRAEADERQQRGRPRRRATSAARVRARRAPDRRSSTRGRAAPCATSASSANTPTLTVYQSRIPTGIPRGEVREQRQREPSRLVERQPAQQVPERGAEQDRQRDARGGEHEVPGRAPRAGLEVAAELDRDPAQDERPQHEEDREVEPREPGGEHRRERDEEHAAEREQPDLVAVPDTARWPRAPAGAPRPSSPRTGAARRRRSRSRP